MNELIPGKRYRWTVEGTAERSYNVGLWLAVTDRIGVSMDLIAEGTLELLPDPLPTTPGSIVRDAEGDAWQLTEGGWRNCFNSAPIELADVQEHAPFTILFDAGAERA